MTKVTYNLKNLLLSGQCFEHGSSLKPPKGLQLELFPQSVSSGSVSDTIVMQNLGYFQLQANPGIWNLKLASGRAKEVFHFKNDLDRMDTSGFANEEVYYFNRIYREEQDIAVRSFGDLIHRVLVEKNVGYEDVQLLDDVTTIHETKKASKEKNVKKKSESGQEGSMWNSLTSLFGSSGNSESQAAIVPSHEDDDKIHVFSLATGHVYERFLRIMMLSVSRRTSKPVKVSRIHSFIFIYSLSSCLLFYYISFLF